LIAIPATRRDTAPSVIAAIFQADGGTFPQESATRSNTMSVKPIPDGFTAVTPHIIVRDVPKAIAFYQAAFGAETKRLHHGPDGKSIMHAEIRIGSAPVMMAEENPQWGSKSPLLLGGTPVTLHLYVKDVDGTFNQATKAGATAAMPPMDMFWGDRYAQVVDPFGHRWSIAAHIKDLTDAEMAKAAQEAFAKMGSKP
jgi:uncharacterized glyoxalase superfamily protein PhnB